MGDNTTIKFKCQNCSRLFESSSSLRRHIREKHGGINMPSTERTGRKVDISTRRFTCPTCGYSFTSQKGVKRHTTVVHGIRTTHGEQQSHDACNYYAVKRLFTFLMHPHGRLFLTPGLQQLEIGLLDLPHWPPLPPTTSTLVFKFMLSKLWHDKANASWWREGRSSVPHVTTQWVNKWADPITSKLSLNCWKVRLSKLSSTIQGRRKLSIESSLAYNSLACCRVVSQTALELFVWSPLWRWPDIGLYGVHGQLDVSNQYYCWNWETHAFFNQYAF